jgi:hypothetical protein
MLVSPVPLIPAPDANIGQLATERNTSCTDDSIPAPRRVDRKRFRANCPRPSAAT